MDIEIVEFETIYAADFARLNYEWIEKYFTVEKHDREILDDPQQWVIAPGGQIFMAIVDGRVAGTVAMIPAGKGVLELTKMAVAPEFRGQSVGESLMRRSIEYAGSAGAEMIFLESHSELGPALSLYRKFGFVDTPPDPDSLYARADVRMQLAITDAGM